MLVLSAYEHLFKPIKNDRSKLVYHNGNLTIYCLNNRLYWNRHGKLERVEPEAVDRYFKLH